MVAHLGERRFAVAPRRHQLALATLQAPRVATSSCASEAITLRACSISPFAAARRSTVSSTPSRSSRTRPAAASSAVDAIQILGLRFDVFEVPFADDHVEQFRPARLIHRDQPLAQRLQRHPQVVPQPRQVPAAPFERVACRRQPFPFGVEARPRHRFPVPDRFHRSGQPLDPRLVTGDRRGQDALAFLRFFELRFLRFQLRP